MKKIKNIKMPAKLDSKVEDFTNYPKTEKTLVKVTKKMLNNSEKF